MYVRTMILEQAIKHAEEVANDYEEMTHDYTLDSEKLAKCAAEHRLLAAWLRELQERRKAPEIIRCKECKLNKTPLCAMSFQQECEWNEDDDYCSWAERSIDADN